VVIDAAGWIWGIRYHRVQIQPPHEYESIPLEADALEHTMSQVEVVKQIEVVPSKPAPRAEDPAKAWYPMGTVRPYSFDEVMGALRINMPARYDRELRIVDQKGVGQHRMRHFRSFTLHIEQPTAGKFRVAGRDGLVTLTFTNGPEGARVNKEFRFKLPRRYVEGGDLDV
jgi:hypothetical protein